VRVYERTTVRTRLNSLSPRFHAIFSLLPSRSTAARARSASPPTPPTPLPALSHFLTSPPHTHFISLYLFQPFTTLSPHTLHLSTSSTSPSHTLRSLPLRLSLTLCLSLTSTTTTHFYAQSLRKRKSIWR